MTTSYFVNCHFRTSCNPTTALTPDQGYERPAVVTQQRSKDDMQGYQEVRHNPGSGGRRKASGKKRRKRSWRNLSA